MKALYAKEDKTCALILACAIIVVIAYLISLYIFLNYLWNIPLRDVPVKHYVFGVGYYKLGYKGVKWMKRNLLKHDKG